MGNYISSSSSIPTPPPLPPQPSPSTKKLSLALLSTAGVFAVRNLESVATKLKISRAQLVYHLNKCFEIDSLPHRVNGGQIQIHDSDNTSIERETIETKLNEYIDREVLHKIPTVSEAPKPMKNRISVSIDNDPTNLKLSYLKSRSFAIYNLEKYSSQKHLTIADLVRRINSRLGIMGEQRRILPNGSCGQYTIECSNDKPLQEDINQTLGLIESVLYSL